MEGGEQVGECLYAGDKGVGDGSPEVGERGVAGLASLQELFCGITEPSRLSDPLPVVHQSRQRLRDHDQRLGCLVGLAVGVVGTGVAAGCIVAEDDRLRGQLAGAGADVLCVL